MTGFSLVVETFPTGRSVKWIGWRGRLWMTIGMYSIASGANRVSILSRLKSRDLPRVPISVAESLHISALLGNRRREQFLIERTECLSLLQESRGLKGRALLREFTLAKLAKESVCQ